MKSDQLILNSKAWVFQALAVRGSAKVFLKDEDEDESFFWTLLSQELNIRKWNMKNAICSSVIPLYHCPSHYLFLSTLNFPIHWRLLLCKYLFFSNSDISTCFHSHPSNSCSTFMPLFCPWGSFLFLHGNLGYIFFLGLKNSLCWAVVNKNKANHI